MILSTHGSFVIIRKIYTSPYTRKRALVHLKKNKRQVDGSFVIIRKIYTSPYTRKRALVHLKKNKRQVVLRIQDAQVAHDIVSSDNILSPEVTVSLLISCLEADNDLIERIKYVTAFMVMFNIL